MHIGVQVGRIVSAHQELRFHSLKGLLLGDVPHNMILVDEGEGIADRYSLLQLPWPAECILLHMSEVAVNHWQYPLQVRLHTDTII